MEGGELEKKRGINFNVGGSLKMRETGNFSGGGLPEGLLQRGVLDQHSLTRLNLSTGCGGKCLN